MKNFVENKIHLQMIKSTIQNKINDEKYFIDVVYDGVNNPFTWPGIFT